MASSSEASITNLIIHKVPNYQLWSDQYGTGIGVNDVVIIPPIELQPRITINGILKGNGSGTITAAIAGTDYARPSDIPDISNKIDKITNGTAGNIVKLDNNGNLVDANLSAAAIPMGKVDSTSTSTIFTATIPGITELKDGVCVWLTNGVVTSASGFTININGLGAKPVYQSLAAATRSTTIFNINYTMLFVYNSTRVSGGCWDCVYGYNSNTNTLLRTYKTTNTNNIELPLLLRNSAASQTAANAAITTYADSYGAIAGTNSPTVNATTGQLIANGGLSIPSLSGILKGDSSGNIAVAIAGTDYQSPLPDQTGNNGKFLMTSGTALSWSAVDALPAQSGHNGKFLKTDGTSAQWSAITASEVGAITTSARGAADGVAPLNSSSKIDSAYLPSYVDDVIEGYYYNGRFYENVGRTVEIVGETGKIYVDLVNNKTYRYSGNSFIEITQGSVVTFNRTLTQGAQIGTLTINGEPTILYAPTTLQPGTDYVTPEDLPTKVSDLENDKGFISGGYNQSSAVTITPTTTNVYSITNVGTMTVPTVIDTNEFNGGSYTPGSFNAGGLSMSIDNEDNRKLNITFSAPQHGADLFNPASLGNNFYTPGIQGSAPSRMQVTDLWKGEVQNARAAAQIFTGIIDEGDSEI